MFTKQTIFALAITPILVFSLSGCRDASTIHEMSHDEMTMQDKDTRTANEGHGAMKMEHSNAKVTPGKSVPLPENFPSDVPIYPGARVAISNTTTEGATIGLETKDDRPKIVRYYEKNLAAHGWKLKTSSSLRGSIVRGRKNNRTCALVVGESNRLGKTFISLMIMK